MSSLNFQWAVSYFIITKIYDRTWTVVNVLIILAVTIAITAVVGILRILHNLVSVLHVTRAIIFGLFSLHNLVVFPRVAWREIRHCASLRKKLKGLTQ